LYFVGLINQRFKHDTMTRKEVEGTRVSKPRYRDDYL